MTENDMQNAIGQAIYPEMIEKLLKLAANIEKTLADFIATVKDILSEDAEPITIPLTIPPRYPVLSIGGRTNTSSKRPQIIRRGCRHK